MTTTAYRSNSASNAVKTCRYWKFEVWILLDSDWWRSYYL